jgi:shikimate kinase
MQRIFLIGYMGAGKTTLGKVLAQVMNLSFIDLDNFIEEHYHRTIGEIFAEAGEDGFRRMEHEALIEASKFEDVVISLGGGTPCFYQNMQVVNNAGISIYLKPSEEVLLRRLIKGKHKRPLLAEKSDDELRDYIHENLEKREPYYLQANIIFESSHLENKEEIVGRAQHLADLLRR